MLILEELDKIIKKNVSFNMIQTWIDGKSDYGLLQALKIVCGDCNSYYTDLFKNSFCTTLDNERMVRLI